MTMPIPNRSSVETFLGTARQYHLVSDLERAAWDAAQRKKPTTIQRGKLCTIAQGLRIYPHAAHRKNATV
jgi:hypothetical protein